MKTTLPLAAILRGLAFLASLPGGAPPSAAEAQRVGGIDVSKWRGFNLLEKFTQRGDAPYREDDFRRIAELGFNFARLPMDYRCYTEPGDWLRFREEALREIDEAVAFGAKHGVHVCLNLHRAPGYCINPPAEPADLWTDEAAQAAFAAHWAMFARRYREVPPERLSFNLLNEPSRNTPESYLRVNRRVIEAIRAEDPDRILVVDGNNVGRDPSAELRALPGVVQATRGYHPGSLSHYKASWVGGSDQWPEPAWPPHPLAGYLYGPAKAELRSPLVLRGDFPEGTEMALKLGRLSGRVKLEARADGLPAGELLCDPQAEPDRWKAVKSDSPWPFHEPAGERFFKVALPRVAKEIAFANAAGDWILFTRLDVTPPGGRLRTHPADPSWGVPQTAHEVASDGGLRLPAGVNPSQTLADYLAPWREFSAAGGAVFVGEWGCFNRTPHPVALAWMRAWLEEWKRAGYGWALWNFRGSFGILDSGRADVAYEDFHGHQLDREMLELLQEYRSD